MFKKLAAPLTAVSLALSAPAYAQNVSNVIFIVDESGSMSGEQDFLEQFVLDLDNALSINQFGTRNYGLVGFGDSSPQIPLGLINEFTVGTGQLGDATELEAAAQTLVTTGGTEDGYTAIQYVLDNYTLPKGTTTFVLVTDEDRDITDATNTYDTILANLKAANVALVSMLDIEILTDTGATAISTDGVDALVQSGTSIVSENHDSFGSGFGTTEADYADLTLALDGGCVADLNQLRAGGDAAAAFAVAFQTCVLNSVTSRPLQLILQYTQINPTQSVAQNIRATLRLGAIFFGANPNTSTMSMSTQNAETLDDLFGVSGLRGYGFVMGSTGSMTGDIDTLSRGLTLGMDYTTPVSGGTMRVGLAINGSKSKTSNDELSIDTETKMAQLYGIYRSNGGLQVLGLASYGKSEDSVNRDTGTVWGHGDQDVTAKSFGIEVGQRFAAGGPASVLMPYVGVSKEIYDADTYTDNLGSVIPGYDQDVSFGKIGLRWENAVGTSIGMVHTEVDASWNRVINEDASIKSGGTVALTAPSTDKDRFDLAVNFGLDTNGGGRVLMTVAGSKSENVSYGSLGLGFEMNF